LPITAAVHRFINCVKQYEKCDPAAGEIPLSVPLLAGNCEHDNLNSYRNKKYDVEYNKTNT